MTLKSELGDIAVHAHFLGKGLLALAESIRQYSPTLCLQCKGSGKLPFYKPSDVDERFDKYWECCPDCEGTGKSHTKPTSNSLRIAKILAPSGFIETEWGRKSVEGIADLIDKEYER